MSDATVSFDQAVARHWLEILPLARSRIAMARRGPAQTSLGKSTGCPAAPAPITAPASVGFWASRS
jgi:hypothetical protein